MAPSSQGKGTRARGGGRPVSKWLCLCRARCVSIGHSAPPCNAPPTCYIAPPCNAPSGPRSSPHSSPHNEQRAAAGGEKAQIMRDNLHLSAVNQRLYFSALCRAIWPFFLPGGSTWCINVLHLAPLCTTNYPPLSIFKARRLWGMIAARFWCCPKTKPREVCKPAGLLCSHHNRQWRKH